MRNCYKIVCLPQLMIDNYSLEQCVNMQDTINEFCSTTMVLWCRSSFCNQWCACSVELERELEFVPTPVGSLTAVDEIHVSVGDSSNSSASVKQSHLVPSSSAPIIQVTAPRTQPITAPRTQPITDHRSKIAPFANTKKKKRGNQKRSVTFLDQKASQPDVTSSGGLAPVPNNESINLPPELGLSANSNLSQQQDAPTNLTPGLPSLP